MVQKQTAEVLKWRCVHRHVVSNETCKYMEAASPKYTTSTATIDVWERYRIVYGPSSHSDMTPFIQVITCALLVKIAYAAPSPSKTSRPTASPSYNPTVSLTASQIAEGNAVAAFARYMPFLTKPNGKKDFICWMASPHLDNGSDSYHHTTVATEEFSLLIFTPHSHISSWFFLFSGSRFSGLHSLDWDSQLWLARL